jgi:hypothetical protein
MLLGRINHAQAGIYGSWAGITAKFGWARSAASRLGRCPASTPAWAAGSPPPVGLASQLSGWAGWPNPGRAFLPCPGWAAKVSPGWAGVSIPGWAGVSIPGWAGKAVPRVGRRVISPAGLLSFHRAGACIRARPASQASIPAQAGIPNPAGLAPACIPAGLGRGSLPRPDYYLAGRIITPVGRDSFPLAYFTHPGSPPAQRASPGTPPGSDRHILHHRMLVLGRSLAQTSISLLS